MVHSFIQQTFTIFYKPDTVLDTVNKAENRSVNVPPHLELSFSCVENRKQISKEKKDNVMF